MHSCMTDVYILHDEATTTTLVPRATKHLLLSASLAFMAGGAVSTLCYSAYTPSVYLSKAKADTDSRLAQHCALQSV